MPPRQQHPGDESPVGDFLGKMISAGLLGMIFFTSLAYGTVEPWSMAVFSALTLLLVALWAGKAVADRSLTISVPAIFLPLAGLFLYGVLQSVPLRSGAGNLTAISFDVEATRLTVEILGYLILAMLLAANFLGATKAQRTWFQRFIVLFGMAMAVFGLVQHFTWNGKFFWLFPPTGAAPFPFGSYVNHNHFAGFIEMIAPLPIALILVRAVRGELAMLYGFAAVMMILANLLSLSRGGMISLVAGVMLVIWLGLRPEPHRRDGFLASSRSKTPRALSRIAAMGVLVVTVGFGLLWVGADPVIRRLEKSELSLQKRGVDPRNETLFQSRGWIWRDSAAMIRENWITGVGLGAFPTAYPVYSKSDGTIFVGQAHNDYLQIVADAGLPGALLALCFIGLLIRETARVMRHRDPAIAGMGIGCAGGVFALLVHSVFDFNLQLPANALLFLTMAAIVSRLGVAATEGKVSESFLERTFRLKMAA